MSTKGSKEPPDNHRDSVSSNPPEEHVSEAITLTETYPKARAAQESFDFERLYLDHRGKVYSTAYRMVGNRADAEDLTQDVFVKVYKKIKGFRGDSAVSTWIYRITMNTCLDFLRKNRRRQAVSIDQCPEPQSGSSKLMKLIEGTVATLPQGYRRVFVLHDIQGLKHSEIAEALGITEGASKSQLHRARAQLRQKLGPYVEDWHWR
jgi:RNA polymerase sigma-70 factor (ECF subfamily)